jgi:hypothetical protein
MRGQLSAEMLILLALILALVFIVYTQLSKSVNNAGNAVDQQTGQLMTATAACSSDADCARLGADFTCSSSRCVKAGASGAP